MDDTGSTDVPGNSIVVGVDGSLGAVGAARWAGALARRLEVALHIVTATPYLGRNPAELAMVARAAAVADHRQWADRYLASALEAVHADHPDLPVTTESLTASADNALAAASQSATLLVLGCDDVSAVGALLLGSTTLATLARARCPVVAWRGEAVAPSMRPILVGVDGSGCDGGALGLAFELADRLDAPLWVVHSWSFKGFADKHRPMTADWDANTKEQWRRLNELIEPWHRRHARVNITRIGESAKASQAMHIHSRLAQLVVVGRRHGSSHGQRIVGSTSLNLLHHCNVPVVVCPFESEAG